MFEATLDQEISEAVDHQRIGLCDNGLHNLELLLSSTNLQFLLQEYRSLLIVVADNLIDNIFPIARNASVKESPVVQRLQRRDVRLAGG